MPIYSIFWSIRWYCNYTDPCSCSYFFVTATIWPAQLHLDISFICWFTVIRVLFFVFWSLHSWRSWCSRRQWVRRYHNGQCTLQTILEVFLNIYVRVACFIDTFFLVRNKTLGLGTIFLTCWIFRISELSDVKLWNWINRNFAVCVQYAIVLFWIDIKVLNLMLPCF